MSEKQRDNFGSAMEALWEVLKKIIHEIEMRLALHCESSLSLSLAPPPFLPRPLSLSVSLLTYIEILPHMQSG